MFTFPGIYLRAILIGGLVLNGTFFFSQTHGQISDSEYISAVEWMYEDKLTKYNDPTEFLPNNQLTREQAAKFFTEFADAVEIEGGITEYNEPIDLIKVDTTLKESVIEALRLGIFKGYPNGTFQPTKEITKAEALTVLIRVINGNKDEDVTPWRKNYHKEARLLGLTKEENVYALDTPISRYEIALILYRASGSKTGQNISIVDQEAQIEELKKILIELGLQSS